MKSFFGGLQNKFKASYEGRYFSTILAEVIRSEPRALGAVFPKLSKKVEAALQSGDATVATEFGFANRQRADLAILIDGNPVALAEIKQADINGSRVGEQLESYRNFIRKTASPVAFSLLSEFQPVGDHLRVFDRSWGEGHGELVRFHRFAAGLEKVAAAPSVRLLLDYMKEEAMTGYTPLPPKPERDLKLLMTRLLPVKHAHGLGRLQSNASIQGTSRTLDTLLGNVQHMEEWLRLSNERHFRRVFTAELRVWPWYDRQAIARLLSRADNVKESYTSFPREMCSGGGLEIYSQARISAQTMGAKKGSAIWIWLGYWLELDIDAGTIHQDIEVGCSGTKSLFPDTEGHRFEKSFTCAYASAEKKVRARLSDAFSAVLSEAADASTSKAVSRFLRKIDLRGF